MAAPQTLCPVWHLVIYATRTLQQCSKPAQKLKKLKKLLASSQSDADELGTCSTKWYSYSIIIGGTITGIYGLMVI